MQIWRLCVTLGVPVLVGCAIYGIVASNSDRSTKAEAAESPTTSTIATIARQEPLAKPGFEKVKVVLDNYCVSCHAGAKPAGEIVLSFKDELSARKKAEEYPEFWNDVSRMVTAREMPPSKAKAKPTDAERSVLTGWVAGLNGENNGSKGHLALHRLNNREYANTIRDLFFLPESWDASADFPADERGDGFDNNSDTLTISPVLIEHYLEAAERTVTHAMNIDGKGDRSAQSRLNAPTQGFKEDFSDWQEKTRLVVEVFLPRAWRRPVSKEEVDGIMKFAALAYTHDGESTSRAAGLAMRAAIMSPEFLFRMERNPEDDGTGKEFQLNDFQLASRLSYFLWSSMPDDELFKIAKEGKLHEHMEEQIKRMLQSPKASSLTKDFMGQWLEIRGLAKTTNCSPELLVSMKGETEHYFNYIVHEDRSIMELLDSDYTFVNQTLAELYGIKDVSGGDFVKVKVDPEQRGGIFTQASFLTLTAKPLGTTRRTSPVNRGKWILENIFNERIPPPPPNVPPLAVDDGKELKGTVRQILEQHRENPDCISCHSRMDPYGFALENYDGFGAWRTKDNNETVDTTGQINGQKFSTPREFRTLLAARKDDFRRALVTKLLGYALARGVSDADKQAIDQICAAVEKDGDRFSSVIVNLVSSDPFQHARGSVTVKKQETRP